MFNKKGVLLQGIILFVIFIALLFKLSYDLYQYMEIKIMPSTKAFLIESSEFEGKYELTYKIQGMNYYKVIPDSMISVFENKDFINIHYHPDIYEQVYILSGLRFNFYLSLFFCIASGLGSIHFLLSDKKK
ncbi:MAG: hypothetical protein M0R46_00320 [Candidatus Muirbacterium halophilum]|nr:hypothetical protein [Candidatus Muirbacterium halophilum]MCK9474337.1 hypothetical protein [Candidatus Muirbacterium halophilum]